MLIVWLKKKQIITLKLNKIENNHDRDKYITTPEFNTLAAVFNARLAKANLVTKIFDNIVSSLDSRIEEAKTINECFNSLLKNLRKRVDLGYFIGRSHFDEDGAQNYLVFQVF